MALRGRPESLPQRLSLARAYRDVARAMGDEECLSDSYAWQAENLTEAGQFAELEALLDRYENLTVARFGIHGYYVRTYRILLALLRGEWSGLEERIEQLLETGLKTRRQDAEGVHSAQMFVLNRDLGRLRALEPIVRQLTTVRGSRTWAPGLIVMCAELGLVGEARDLLDELARDGFAGVPKDDMFTASLVFTAEACCKLGDAERARTLYALLLPYADQTVNHPRAACLGGTALYLGMLARTFGDADNARKHFDAALASHRAMTAWPWLARTELHYGALLVALESPADQAAGRELLRDAEQLASRLSMVTLLDEIGTLLSGSDAHESLRDGLTAREVEVLRLLAMGRSNKDISTVLSISLSTVATHVRSILSKTHCANRTEAAAYAIREYLQPDGARRS